VGRTTAEDNKELGSIYKVYLHKNTISGKVYIGLTKQQEKRRWQNGLAYYRNPYFFATIKKYGWNKFEHKVLKSGLTQAEAIRLEKYFIKLFNACDREYGYNLQPGGTLGFNGVLSEESKHKISEKNKGRARIGKGVAQYNMHGTYISSFESIKAALEHLNIKDRTNYQISKCCKGTLRHAYDFQWRYIKNISSLEDIESVEKYLRGGECAYSRGVYCTELNKNFSSIKEAAIFVGLKDAGSSIILNCKKKQKSAGKKPGTKVRLHWNYREEGQNCEPKRNI